MAKFLKRDATSGEVQEELTLATSAGAGSAGRVPELDSNGKFDISMLPSGIGADTIVIQTSEALVAGDFVQIWDNAGVGRVRKADASTVGKAADGFVLAAFGSGANATVYFEGQNNQRTGLVVGTRYYLSDTTAGSIVSAPVVGAGKTHQYLGKAISTTTLAFEPEDAIRLV
ncbi:MAG: hypothetical protein ACRDBG_00705 [Waterburya sp.]